MAKRIIIIGATSGIGYDVAQIYINRGYQVGLAGRRVERLEEIRRQDPENIHIQQVDVTSGDAPERLMELINATGGMDEFLLSSGIGHQNKNLDEHIEMDTVQTNVVGFTQVVLTAHQYFREHGGGHISVISSIAGTKGLGVAPSYSATKRYQNLYIDALAQLARMEKHPVTFTDIRPGFVRTDLLKDGHSYPLLMSSTYAARRIVHAIDKKKRVAVIDWKYSILTSFWKLIPQWIWERLPIHN